MGYKLGYKLHGSSSELDADEEVVRMERWVSSPLDQENFQGRGEENSPATGHYLRVQLSKLLQEEP
jgi:hypothetical protein